MKTKEEIKAQMKKWDVEHQVVPDWTKGYLKALEWVLECP